MGAAFAWQPRCWLELSGGVGYKRGDVTVDVPEGVAGGTYYSISVPLRARLWMLRKHSPIVDVGAGFMRVSVDASVPATAISPEVDRSAKYDRGFVFAGIGYGYRSDDSFRLALLLGVSVLPSDITPFTDLSDPKLYPELSLGFLW